MVVIMSKMYALCLCIIILLAKSAVVLLLCAVFVAHQVQ